MRSAVNPSGQRNIETEPSRIAGIDVLGQPVDLGLAEPKGLGDVAENRTCPVGDDIGDHGGALSSVAPVAVLDDLFTAVGFEIEVDVGGPTSILGEKAFEGKPEPDRVDLGQPDAPTYRRITTRTADLTVDIATAGELNEIPHHEEVAGESELLDHRQFMFEPGLGVRVDPPVPAGVHLPCAFKREMPEVLHLGAEMTRHGKVGQLGCDEFQVEGQSLPEFRGSLDGPRVSGETSVHLFRSFEIALVGGRPESILEIECSPTCDRRHHFGEMRLGRVVVVDVVGGHGGDLKPGRHLGEHIVAKIIFGHSVMPQFDPQAGPEHLPEPGSGRHGPGKVPALGGPGYRSLPAAGEGVEVSHLGGDGEVLPRVHRTILLSSELCLGDEATDRPVPARSAGEKDQMVRLRKIGGLGAVHSRAPAAPLRIGTISIGTIGVGGSGLINCFGSAERVSSRIDVEV